MAQTGSEHLSGAEALTNAQKERVWKFAKQSAKYPLSAEGAKLLEAANRLLAGNFESTQEINSVLSALPTVERPHPELFRDLNSETIGIPEDDLFGPKLANIQVTKGCSHQCTFCAADASKGVDAMPFSAVVKFGQKLKQHDEKVRSNWNSWAALFCEKTGIDIQTRPDHDMRQDAMAAAFRYDHFMVGENQYKIPDYILDAFRRHPLAPMYEVMARYRGGNWPEHKKQIPLSWRNLPKSICNYYDSDSFDYQDPSFCHHDGTPAHYGDVFEALATESHPIHITTAGWPLSHTFAEQAASKLVGLYTKNPKLFSGIRISVNPSEIWARRAYTRHGTYEEYYKMMQHVIESLALLNPVVLFFYDNSDERLEKDINLFQPTEKGQQFFDQVCRPLRRYMLETNEAQGQKTSRSLMPPHYFTYNSPRISTFSGPMAEADSQGNDVMACMPGWHVLPSGQICEQAISDDAADWKADSEGSKPGVPDGSRPVPLPGKKLW